MRIEIDFGPHRLGIDTTSGEIAGRWFAEHLQRMMSADAQSFRKIITVYPGSDDEAHAIGRGKYFMAEDDLRELAEALIAGADRMKARAKVKT